jgi:hypothetical protein
VRANQPVVEEKLRARRGQNHEEQKEGCNNKSPHGRMDPRERYA